MIRPATRDPQVLDQMVQPAGVLGGDDVRRRQQLDEPRGRVAGVADRCRRQHDPAGSAVLTGRSLTGRSGEALGSWSTEPAYCRRSGTRRAQPGTVAWQGDPDPHAAARGRPRRVPAFGPELEPRAEPAARPGAGCAPGAVSSGTAGSAAPPRPSPRTPSRAPDRRRSEAGGTIRRRCGSGTGSSP